MNKNITFKIIISFFIIIFLLANFVLAGSIDTNVKISKTSTNEFEKVGNRVVGIIQAAGIVVSVAMTIVVGIRFMICSFEEKAEYKKMATLYLVGAFLIFSTTTITKIIYDIFK